VTESEGPTPPPRRPNRGRPPLPPRADAASEGRFAIKARPAITASAVFLVGAHLVFSRAELSFLNRFLLAIPALIFFWELHRFLARDEERILPFNVVGLFYFYIPFSFPAFFDIQFFDISGPVNFTDQARASAATAVAFGGLCLYGGMRAGELLGVRLRPSMLGLLPPPEVPSAFPRAVLWYGAACVLLAVVQISAPGAIPGTISLVVFMLISVELAMALPMVKPEMFQGQWSRYAAIGFMLMGWATGLLRGMLEPVFRLGMPFVAARWAFARKLSIALILAGAAVYLVFQPAKSTYRAQIWGRDQVGYTERVEAWNFAFSNVFSREDSQDQVQSSTISRIAELDAVFHAFDMMPGQVQSLDGEGWVPILTSPIPRFIWRDKPTTATSAEARYSVVFRRQSEEGAKTTAIVLPLLVDGYWNFGWPGIAFACGMVGLWVGICQRIWSSAHWALEAMGLVQLARLMTHGQLNAVYGGLFQSIAGLLGACWGVYWLAGFLSKTQAPSVRRFGSPAVMGAGGSGRPRRAPAR